MTRLHSMTTLLAALVIGAASALALDEPPRDVRLEEKKLETLSRKDTDALGAQALAIAPQKWKHAETEHFIVHYRRATEAQKVVREVEYDCWLTGRVLGATKEQYARKSHIFVFQDEREWAQFRHDSEVMEWSASFAHGDDLYLHVGGMGEGFDSGILAHETAHAVVARLYPGRRWPRWLNEGLAEYMATASVATRKQLYLKGLQRDLSEATLDPVPLAAIVDYPKDREEVTRFYQSSEKFVRFLMTQWPPERFPRFVDEILAGTAVDAAIMKIYGDQTKDYAEFLKQYRRFSK